MKQVKRYLPFAAWTIIVAAVIVSFGFVVVKQSDVICTAVLIHIEDNGNYFIENNDVLQMISGNTKQPVGKQLNVINTAVLENIMLSNPYVKDAQVFLTLDGKMHINIIQRQPVFRVMNTDGDSFYIDEDGYFMPVCEKFTSSVIVANGNITDRYIKGKVDLITDSVSPKNTLSQLFSIAKQLQSDTVWQTLIEQIYVNDNNEFELVTRIGNQTVLIGDSQEFKQKLEKLMVFYKEGLNKIGWTNYTTINLKYDNQVVCTKQNDLKKQTVVMAIDSSAIKRIPL